MKQPTTDVAVYAEALCLLNINSITSMQNETASDQLPE
jgi:hypothetical protein